MLSMLYSYCTANHTLDFAAWSIYDLALLQLCEAYCVIKVVDPFIKCKRQLFLRCSSFQPSSSTICDLSMGHLVWGNNQLLAGCAAFLLATLQPPQINCAPTHYISLCNALRLEKLVRIL